MAQGSPRVSNQALYGDPAQVDTLRPVGGAAAPSSRRELLQVSVDEVVEMGFSAGA